MIEKDKKTDIEMTSGSPVAAVSTPSEPSVPAAEASPEVKKPAPKPVFKPQMSLGEKRYNFLLYKVVNFWLNLGISLWITDIFARKSGTAPLDFMFGTGKKHFDNGVAAGSKFLTMFRIPPAIATWLTKVGLGTFSLNSGGNILLIPTKFIEDDKRGWVYWLNEKMGVKQIASDGHKETKDEIYIEQEQDKQSWGRMIWRRFLGWGTTTSVGLTMDWVGQRAAGRSGQDIFTDALTGVVNKGLNSGYVPGGKTAAANPVVQRYMSYAALDTFYTMITSKILHATNGAHKKHMPKEIDDEAPAAPKAPNEVAAEKPTRHAENVALQNKPMLAPSASHGDRVKSPGEQSYVMSP